ncbi:hypothetical protein A9Q84_04645 [Halobacteriovorax marinus]|uniref:Flagellar protein FliL n=1 Tax=Halobacteriovorax marinus TaxID=97084 RepID=A0A1Y5FAY2_9BACT|nr:hypothetical protein A9Q84_04645 [Halobacteriovorax marinus]
MKIWLKIEQILNNLLETIFGMFSNFITGITPGKIKNTLSKGKSKIAKTKLDTKKIFNEKGLKALSSSLELKNKTLQKANELQHKSVELVSKAKEVDYKRVDYKKLFLAGLFIFAPFFGKIKGWFIALSPKMLIGSTIAATVVSLSSISIYTQSKKISDEATAQARDPASEVENAEEASKRKSYYKLQEKRFTITHVTMPVYIESVNTYKSLSIDFTFISSNRYIKHYFDRNRHLIKNRLNSTIQPVIPAFPLKEEGKAIIKDKIQKELNLLIKELKIKGEIKEVYIKSILAG